MTALSDALERLRDVLSDARTMQLLAELPATEDAAPLRIAFVGPYNVGKSTLLRVLTGDRSIATDAKPETAEVEWYPWRDVLLGDTPGWFSGFEEHDLASHAALRRDADLVAVVMSVEMGGGPFVTAAHEVLVELGFAGRCLLVVNKANAEDHDRDVVAKEVQRRLPRDTDVPVVFTDAQDLHDALDPDRAYSDRVREVLRRTSGIGLLEQELDRLVHERGGGARDAATGLQARRIVEAAREAWQPDAEEQALTLLVADLAGRLQGTQDGLRQSFKARVSALEADLADLGEDVAGEVEGAAERAPQDWRAAVIAFQEWVDEHTAAELAALEEASDLSVQALGAHLDAVVDIAGPDEPQRPGGPGLLGRISGQWTSGRRWSSRSTRRCATSRSRVPGGVPRLRAGAAAAAEQEVRAVRHPARREEDPERSEGRQQNRQERWRARPGRDRGDRLVARAPRARGGAATGARGAGHLPRFRSETARGAVRALRRLARGGLLPRS